MVILSRWTIRHFFVPAAKVSLYSKHMYPVQRQWLEPKSPGATGHDQHFGNQCEPDCGDLAFRKGETDSPRAW
jgi:hypothetical protein